MKLSFFEDTNGQDLLGSSLNANHSLDCAGGVHTAQLISRDCCPDYVRLGWNTSVFLDVNAVSSAPAVDEAIIDVFQSAGEERAGTRYLLPMTSTLNRYAENVKTHGNRKRLAQRPAT